MSFLQSSQQPSDLSFSKALKGSHAVSSREQFGAFGQGFFGTLILQQTRFHQPLLGIGSPHFKGRFGVF